MDELKDIGNPLDVDLDKASSEKLFEDLAQVDGFVEFLHATMGMDVKRFFAVPKEQQDLVKGAFSRTKYFYEQILRAQKRKDSKID